MKRLAELRNKKALSQIEFAKIIGTTQSTVSNWEKGKREVDNETLIRIAQFFDVTTDYLLEKDTADAKNSNELDEYLEELRERPEMRMLFSLAKGATKEDVEQAVAIIEALRKTKNG